jgi:nucleotide-binding universal stress UspA family protein
MRTRIRRILCPVDFSQQSSFAFQRACAIAREHHAELRLLHVLEPRGGPFERTLDSVTHAELMDRLRTFMEPAGGGVHLGAAVREGEPASQILHAARTSGADLIVMGAGRGGGGLEPRARRGDRVGHIARIVADRSICPVLVVPSPRDPSESQAGPFREIVCAMDTDPGSLGVLERALSLAQETQGVVTLIHIEPEPSAGDVTDALAAAVPEEALHWCNARVIVASGDPAEEIVELATAIGADLIVIGPARAEISTTHAVIAAAPCPVLIAQTGRRAARRHVVRAGAEQVNA